MNIPQNRFDLLVAAQTTAAANLTPENDRALTASILNAFDELKIDDSFFPDFDRTVRDRIATYNNLKGQKLVVPAAAPTPAAPAA